MDESIVKKALKMARNAFDNDEVPVGAVLFHSKTHKIIAQAYNKTMQKHDATAHAEIEVLKKACKKLGTDKLVGYSLFVTLEPCAMCATAISLARIDTLYFGAYDPKTGGVCQGPAIYTHPQIHHKPDVVGGIYADICGQLLKDFFKLKRGKHA